MDKNELSSIVTTLRTLADSLQALIEPETKVTFEEVRSILASKSRNGKTAQVKELISAFGATKLSDVSPKDFVNLLEKAEEL